MRIAKSALAAAAALTLFCSGALAAPQDQDGKIIKLDRAKHEVTIQHWTPGVTVGATSSQTDTYKLNHMPSFDSLHDGDQVKFKTDEIGGEWTVTQILKK